MFKKILIANRGEIACRVMRTAKRMGIATVAVYSDADDGALHMRMADEAVHVGGAASSESYLVAERIVQAAKDTGAEAIHPGYGFLSENAAFAEMLEAAGIAFIGPNTLAIGAMGDKIESKKLAAKAGVNTIPGHTAAIPDADKAVEIAKDVGFPVMIKASAGGGGKGMRIARNEDEARSGFESAVNEARSSFGDDRVFIERFVEDPRHIEIQVMADSHGNTVYLGERECSVQRRHQKLFEEAPSPALNEEQRKFIGETAAKAAAQMSYLGVGTMEFLYQDGEFFFIEMNTRVQVEHCVTEMITGIDIVREQLLIASGEKLSFTQADIQLRGHSIECRINAEDPRTFMPSPGRINTFHAPGGNGVRVDSHVYSGYTVPPHYDSMIGKLITHADTREAALAKMAQALDELVVEGIRTNAALHRELVLDPSFVAGGVSIHYLESKLEHER